MSISSKLDYACKFCNQILKDPILLPCGLSICNEHTKNLENNSLVCKTCNVPHTRFSQNHELKTQIETLNSHLTENEFKWKKEFRLIYEQIEEMLDDFNLKANEFEYFTHEHFANIECQIELRRENLKMRIDDLSQELLEIVREKKQLFVNKSKQIHVEDLKKIHEREDNDTYEIFRQLEISLDKIRSIEMEQTFQIKEIEKRMILFEKLKSQVEKVEFLPSFSLNVPHFGLVNSRLDFLVKIYDGITVKFWDIEKNLCVKELNLKDNDSEFYVRDFKLTQKRQLLTLCDDSLLRIFDLKTGKCLKSFGKVETLHYEDEMHLISNKLIAITKRTQIKVFNYETCECVKSIDTNSCRVRILKVLENQNFLLVFNGESDIKLLDFEGGKIIQTFSGHKEHVFNIQVLTIDTFASCTLTQIKIFNINTGQCLNSFEDDFGVLLDLQLTEHGQLISCSSSRPRVRILSGHRFESLKNIETNVPIKRIKVLENDRLVCFCPNKEFNVLKMTISIWDMNLQRCLKSFIIENEDFLPNRFEFSSFY